MNPLKHSLPARLSLSALLVVSTVFFGAFAYSRLVYREQIRSLADMNADFDIRALSERIAAVRVRAEESARTLVSVAERNPITPELTDALFRSVLGSNRDLYGGTLALEAGDPAEEFAPYYYWPKYDMFQKTTMIREGHPYQRSAWFTLPLERGGGVWSKPYLSLHADRIEDNIFMITYSLPARVLMGSRRHRAVAAVDLSLDWLDKTIASFQPYEGSYAFVLRTGGEYILPPPVGRRPDAETERRLFAAVPGGESGSLPRPDGYVLYRPIERNMSIALFIPNEALFGRVEATERRLLLIGALCLALCCGGVAWVIVRSLRPLRSLSGAAAQIAAGSLENPLPPAENEDEVGRLVLSFEQMRVALKEYIENLTVTTAVKERLESELAVARVIQAGFLPRTFPPFPERRGIDLHAALRPAREVGGDLYDFFLPENDTLFFAVGDVSGKGVAAALFMAVTRTLLKGKSSFEPELRDLVRDVNRDLLEGNDQCMFVTLLAGRLNLTNGHLSLLNAGHDAPLLLTRESETAVLRTRVNPPLGLAPVEDFAVLEHDLRPGDRLLMYTDGVTEARAPAGAAFGRERLAVLFARHGNAGCRELVEAALAALDAHTQGAPQEDDVTLLALRWTDKGMQN